MSRSSFTIVSLLALASLVAPARTADAHPRAHTKLTVRILHGSHASRVVRRAPQAPSSPQATSGFEKYNVDRINAYRSAAGLPPLVLDATLSSFARDGSLQLMNDHVPHGHFRSAGDALWRRGFVGGAAENQGSPTGWPRAASDPTQNEQRQIDQILASMMSEGPGGGHHDNMMSAKARRVGIGLVEDGEGKLYLTNDFSE